MYPYLQNYFMNLKRKSVIPIIVKPCSSRHSFTGLLMTMIFCTLSFSRRHDMYSLIFVFVELISSLTWMCSINDYLFWLRNLLRLFFLHIFHFRFFHIIKCANIYWIAIIIQFVIDYVFQYLSFIREGKVQSRISKAGICKIIFPFEHLFLHDLWDHIFWLL